MSILSEIGKLFGANSSSQPMKKEPALVQPTDKKDDSQKKRETDGKAHIHNLIIVDESGSMSGIRRATVSGINETINTIRDAQKAYEATQEHFLTLVTFDSGGKMADVRTMIDSQHISQVEDFNDYLPNGCTPLYDAIGDSLTRLQRRIKDDKDAAAVVTIITDGLENASKHWTATSVSKLIEQLKEQGWSFSYMGSDHDVKKVKDMLSIDNAMEFSHDNLGAGNMWRRERFSRHSFSAKLDALYGSRIELSEEELIARKRQFAAEYYGNRVTPDYIDTLEENGIFVFGSNSAGLHDGGAAAFAMKRFGAVFGQGEGLQGQSYAIPTTGGVAEIVDAVNRFVSYAEEYPELHFYVTKIGCGNAGFSENQISPLFKECIKLENVSLPSEFWEAMGLKMV